MSEETRGEHMADPHPSDYKDLGTFEKDPTFAHLWDRCVYDLFYDAEKFTAQFSEMLAQSGVNKDSPILDTAAGSGFPALDLSKMGYDNITCVDGWDDQVELFNEKAKQAGLSVQSEKCLWQDLKQKFPTQRFNALICKGSLWYAEGGWNKDFVPSREGALKAIHDTLTTFYDLLEDGGVLYVDKFKDTEVDHKDTVGTFDVGGVKKELMFFASRDREAQVRRAAMITKDVATGEETGLPNVTYDLKETEMEDVLRGAGFDVTRQDLSEEKFFTHWLATKRKK